jgi:glycosyltransferase involved in cell wall biosynthesis
MNNRITIITVTYNAVSFLEDTILSVINQTYDNKEYIVIDGGSTDGTIDVIKKYEDKIDYWISEPDKGIYDAMNKGVNKSSGIYCNFMNAGDKFFDKNVLAKIFSCNFNEDILAGSARTSYGYTWQPMKEDELSLFRIAICHQAAFIKKELLIKHPYDINLRIVGDYKFWVESLFIDNCSYKSLSLLVCDYASPGVSNDQAMLLKEKKKVLLNLFPPRIINDYLLFEKYYNPLYRLCLPLAQRKFIIKFIDKIVLMYRKWFKN